MNNYWKKYKGALICKSSPYIEIKEGVNMIRKMIIQHNVLFARWTSNFDCKEKTDFWFIIKEKFEGLEELSYNTRKSIRKGLKLVDIRMITREEFLLQGYEVYFAAFKRYINYSNPMSEKRFNEHIQSLEFDWDFWGVFDKTGKLVGYSQNKIYEDYCNYSITKFHPNFLKLRVSDVLFYKMTDYYLNSNKLRCVSGGTRTLFHKTNIQREYVRKFKFRKAYCQLHVEYHPVFKILIIILYPFKILFAKINNRFFFQLSALLKQEEIVRNNKYI